MGNFGTYSPNGRCTARDPARDKLQVTICSLKISLIATIVCRMVPVPATLTETSFEDARPEVECAVCEMKLRKDPSTHNGVVLGSTESEIYNRMLPKNEPPVMAKVRRWERSMGFVTPLRWINLVAITLFHLITVAWFGVHFYLGCLPQWRTVLFSKCSLGFLQMLYLLKRYYIKQQARKLKTKRTEIEI